MLNKLLDDLELDRYVTLILTNGLTVSGAVAESGPTSMCIMTLASDEMRITTVARVCIAGFTDHRDKNGTPLGYYLGDNDTLKIEPH